MQRNLSHLKASHLIPPAAALALVVSWNAIELRSIASAETETSALQEKISTAAAAEGGAHAPLIAKSAPKAEESNGRESSKWQDVSTRIRNSRNSEKARMLAMAEFEKKLADMSQQEKIAALDEIEGSDLTAEERQSLESAILDPLMKEDPEYVLDRFADRIEGDENGIGWQLSSALEQWAKTDLAAATAWLDRQIANGNFDSKTLDGTSEMRMKFEASLMESLLASDPEAAAQRLAGLPEAQRRETLQQIPFEKLSAAEQKSYTDMVHQLVPADEQDGAIGHVGGELASQGYDKVSAYLDSTGASPANRLAAAGETAQIQLEKLAGKGNVTLNDVDQLRMWLAKEAPDNIDKITGKAIAEAAQNDGKFQFSEASQLVLHYQQASGKDDVLISFLKSYSARSNLDEAIQLADMITDPKRRVAVLKSLR